MALLAVQFNASRFIVSTAVDQAYVDIGKPTQKSVGKLTVSEAKKLLDAGQFPKGSMGHKIQAIINSLTAGGKEAVITSPKKLGKCWKARRGPLSFPTDPAARKQQTPHRRWGFYMALLRFGFRFGMTGSSSFKLSMAGGWASSTGASGSASPLGGRISMSGGNLGNLPALVARMDTSRESIFSIHSSVSEKCPVP